MRLKNTLLGTLVLLLIIIAFISSSNAKLQNENELLRQKLATAEGIAAGLREGQNKIIRYQECIAKIFIIPRDQSKAIEGSLDDPATALEQCRILVGGITVSPAQNPSSQQGNTAPTPSSTQPSGSPAPPPQSPPPPEPPPMEILGLPLCIPLTGVCVR